MSNINQERGKLDAKLASFGYEHPDSSNYGASDYNPYKAYTDEGDDPYVTQEQDQYATFTSVTDKKTVQKSDVCPVCDIKALYSCNCSHGEMMCANKHMWYYTSEGKVVLGDPHKK